MATLNKLTGEPLNDLTLFVVDTPANPLALQEIEKAQTTHVIYGPGLEQPLANYDPTTQSWKTSEDTSLWGVQQLLATLPKSGMTRSGALFLQPDWVRPIDAKGLLSWPTPRASAAMSENISTIQARLAKGKKWGAKLEQAVAMYPTMSANGMGNTGSQQILQRQVDCGQMTQEEKKQMTAGRGGKLNPTWVEWLMGFPLGWTDLED